MTLTPAKLKPRREAARKEYDSFTPMREEAYQYAIPYRKTSRHTGTGEKRVDQAFDHTAIEAAFRFAGKLQQDLMPAGEDNFELEPGPMVINQDERDKLAKGLAPMSKVAAAFFDDPDWGMAFHEMAIDLSAGTGAILMNGTSDLEKLWEPLSVPIEEIMLEAGPNGRVTGIFWDRKMPVRVLFETWPEGEFGPDLKKLLKDNPEFEIVVHVDTVWMAAKGNAKAGRWHMVTWCDKQDALIFESKSRTCPWLVPRYFRVAGEVYGRGLVHLAMPTIKTLNTAARLQLQAAAIAMLGIYTAVDDGVFNPDLSPVAPGQFWKVQRNGGSLGPSVQRFPDPRLDLTQIVMQDLRTGVRSTMMDDDLPMAGEAVKSPTEILERIRKADSDHVGAFSRLVLEIIVPAVKRVLELAYDRGYIRTNVSIDQLLVRVRVKSPMAVARMMSRVKKHLEWAQIVFSLEQAKAAAPGAARIVDLDALAIEAGRDMGVDEQFIVSVDTRKAIDENTAKEAAAMQAAKLAFVASTGQPPEPAA